MRRRGRAQVLEARLRALAFVRPEHLDISHDFASDGALALAQKELKKINAYKVEGGIEYEESKGLNKG